MVSDGASKLEVLDHMTNAGLQVKDIVVLIDRGQGGVQLMERHGLRCHAVAPMQTVLAILHEHGLITPTQVEESHRFMQDARSQSGA